MPADALKTMPLDGLLRQMDNVAREAGRPAPRLLAVCKRQPATAVAELAHKWRRLREEKDEWVPAFGENYVQEAQAKQDELSGSGFPASELEWHLIGHLQSNKAKEAATRFDWIQTVDRLRLVDALARARPPERGALNVLVQVNVDDEGSKHGCTPGEIRPLAAAIAAQPQLALRGLMAIPAPHPEIAHRRDAFARMRALFDDLRTVHPRIDTLSMGMSDDYALAIAEGATMVRVGTALFGPRK